MAPAQVDGEARFISTAGKWLIEPKFDRCMEVHDPAKNEVYWGQGIYREVTAPEKIVFTWHWTKDTLDGKNLHPGSEDTLVTVQFFARGNAAEVVLTHAVLSSNELRDDHNRGWNGCFEALEELLQA
jgi:uncharacterized protein YndB with AHSA1/START domain